MYGKLNRQGMTMKAAVCCALLMLAASGVTLAADRIELVTGEVLIGRVVSRSDTRLIFEHELLGKVSLPESAVKQVDVGVVKNGVVVTKPLPIPSPPKPKPVPPKPAPKPTLTPAQVKAFEKDEKRKWLKDWKMQFSLGLTGTSGNSDGFNIRTGFKASKKDETGSWKLDGTFWFAEANGERSQNALEIGMQRDWKIKDSPWFWFAEGRYRSDEFKPYDHRLSVHGGLGYDMNTQGVPAKIRLGAGVTKEWGGGDNRLKPESLFGGEFTWVINEKHSINFKSTIYPNQEDFTEFRMISTADWTIKLDPASGLSLKIGLWDEYETDVPKGYKNNDMRVFASVVIDF